MGIRLDMQVFNMLKRRTEKKVTDWVTRLCIGCEGLGLAIDASWQGAAQ